MLRMGQKGWAAKDHGLERRETWELEVVCSEAWLQSGKNPESQAHLIPMCVQQGSCKKEEEMLGCVGKVWWVCGEGVVGWLSWLGRF